MNINLYFSENMEKNNYRFLQDVFFEHFYKKKLINKVNNIDDCDIIVIYEKYEIDYFLNCSKNIILINADPATNSYCKDEKIINDNKVIHIMNAFNGTLFSSNFENGYVFKDNFTELKFNPVTKVNKSIVIMNTFVSYDNEYNVTNIYNIPNNLVDLGNKLSTYLFEKNIATICGKDWPNVKCIDTFTNNPILSEDKFGILNNRFGFMVCFENFEINYWITEKLFDCIENNILPIYYSSETIYEIFPKKSFIDYRDFKVNSNEEINFELLYKYILNMSAEEYNERMKLCVDCINKIKKEFTSEKYLFVYQTTCHKIIKKLQNICANNFNHKLYKILYQDIPVNFDKNMCYEHYINYGVNEDKYNPTTITCDLSVNSNNINKMIQDNETIIFTHMGGGGTEEYLKTKFEDKKNLIVRPLMNSNYLFITNDNKYINSIYSKETVNIIKKNNISCMLCEYTKFNKILNNFKGNIIINHLFHYNMEKIIKIIENIKLNNNNNIHTIIHDYYYINKLPQPIEKDFYKTEDLNNSKILKLSNTITCPSNWVRDKYNFYIPNIIINVKYHLNYEIASKAILPKHNNLKVLIYGEITKNKGEDIIVNLINNSKVLNYTIYGMHSLEKLIHNKENVCLNGPYENKEMLNIINYENPAVILFASVFAETFCYALSHSIYSGYPVICPNFGSFVELSKYINNKLLIDPYNLNECVILEFINSLKK